MAWLRDEIDFVSKIKYALWRLSRNRYAVTLKLKSGPKIVLRPRPFHDGAMAQEVLVDKVYQVPSNIVVPCVQLIVDVGANVGYSCVWWLNQYPQASVIAYEPHPGHITQIHNHLTINLAGDKVKVISKAASTKIGHMYLTNNEFSSTLVDRHTADSFPVETTDWFDEISNKAIDLLKIDIEGSEYPLLSDNRFANVKFKLCVIEWHKTDQYEDGCAWCVNRLNEMGYCTQLGPTDIENGLIWAFRSEYAQECI